jgi:hypothetical protein
MVVSLNYPLNPNAGFLTWAKKMKGEGRLTGSQAEEWFKKFAERAYMLSNLEYPTTSLVRLLNKDLAHRLTNARMFIYGHIPLGDEWIDEILRGKTPVDFTENNQEKLSAYLMDRVVATDAIVKARDNSGILKTIAVDVTVNPTEEEEKLGRIQGRREPDDAVGYNRNVNLPSVRKELGIDKHLVLVLNSDRQKLPSYEKLLSEIFAFANGRSNTKSINLVEVPENQRFKWNEVERLDPKKMWDKYSKGVRGETQIEISKQAALKAIRAGYDRSSVIEMLKYDPQYLHLLKNNPKIADNHPKTIYDSARERFELAKAKNPTHHETNIQALRTGRFIVRQIGKENAKGERVALGKVLSIKEKGDDLRIEATSDKRVVVEFKDRSLKGNPTSAELEWLKGWSKAIQADQQRSIQNTKDPGLDITQ